MTKSNRVCASNPHVGVVAHITKQELSELLSRVDIFNGFANRFLWFCARRSKILPLAKGMNEATIERLGREYARRLSGAKRLGQIQFNDEARRLYEALYDDMTEERSGLYAMVTSRAEAQVIRLALTYALLDTSPVITVDHLTAAIAVWDYCDASAAYVFGANCPNPLEKRIIDALSGGPLTTKELHGALGGHTPGDALRGALENLESRGSVGRLKDSTSGRSRTTWSRLESTSANEAKKAN
jgi:hypothetical protein